jgi:hypothetical protein
MALVCVRPEEPLDHLIGGTFTPQGQHFDIVVRNVRRVASDGFTRMADVRGDGNCFIYACIAYLQKTRDKNVFATTLLPFCGRRETVHLLNDSVAFIRNATNMLHVAEQIRSEVLIRWTYKGECSYHMDEHAVDGLARHMVMRLLGIDEVVCYSIIPDEREPSFRKTVIPPTEPNLRPDIEHKWQVALLSLNGYSHYCVLLR